MARKPLVWRCRCTREGVLRAVRVMGRAELEDVLRTDKRVEATCHFCNTQYVVEEDELREVLAEVPE
jgi:molecular chaperone Hsp33